MNRKIINVLLFLICMGFCFNNIPVLVQMNFIGGLIGNYIIIYPLAMGFFYTAYCQYKYKNVLVDFDKFLKFSFAYIGINMLSLVIGLYNYPYYDVVFSGPINQIEKLPILIKFFENHGIMLDQKLALGAWIVARQIKGIFLETFWCFGGAYMIFCWYKNNYYDGIKILVKGTIASLLIFLIYGVIDIFYLLNNQTAKSILETVNPYIHTIKSGMGWWPPLLWKGQLRSVFSEPSNIGNYIAIALPVVWYMYYRKKSNLLLVILFITIFMVVLTKARTAYAMFFGISVLFPILLIYFKRIDLLKMYVVITFCGIVAFGCGVKFLGYATNFKENTINTVSVVDNKTKDNKKNSKNNVPKVTIEKVIDENFVSLASSNRRSNRARYAAIKANLRIAVENPLLGVGKGLATAYIVDNYTEEDKKSGEVRMWVSNFKKNGVFASGSTVGSAMNEYVTRLAQNGILGLGIFLLPFIYVIKKLFILCKRAKDNKQLDIAFILFALINSLVAGCNNSITVIYGTWILLGIAFAIVYSEKDKFSKCE